jgi:hypothetical protein
VAGKHGSPDRSWQAPFSSSALVLTEQAQQGMKGTLEIAEQSVFVRRAPAVKHARASHEAEVAQRHYEGVEGCH